MDPPKIASDPDLDRPGPIRAGLTHFGSPLGRFWHPFGSVFVSCFGRLGIASAHGSANASAHGNASTSDNGNSNAITHGLANATDNGMQMQMPTEMQMQLTMEMHMQVPMGTQMQVPMELHMQVPTEMQKDMESNDNGNEYVNLIRATDGMSIDR